MSRIRRKTSCSALLAGVLAASMLLVGCKEEDTGTCCKALSPDAAAALPQPSTPDGGIPHDTVGEHPAFDCDKLVCISQRGSDPFCSRRCSDDCPPGFECESVLEASPGAGARIQPEDRFCVRKTCAIPADCPEDFSCKIVREDYPSLMHCVRDDDACAK